MNPLLILSVNPTGMFSYGKCETIQLYDKGLVFLKGINEDAGGSNGAGKSSLFNSICEILFDENQTRVSGAAIANSVLNCGYSGRVEFVSWENARYRVTRCRDSKLDVYPVDNDTKTKYIGNSVFLDRWNGIGWTNCQGHSMSDTNDRIIKAIGMGYDRFISISYISSRIGHRFIRGTNKDRMDILSDIIGLSEWDVIQQNCRNSIRDLESREASVRQNISYFTGQLESLEYELSRLDVRNTTDSILKLNSDLQELTVKKNVIANTQSEKKKEIERVCAMQRGYKIKELQHAVFEVESEIKALINADVIIKKPDEEVYRPRYNELNEQRMKAEWELNNYEKRCESLKGNECPTCGSKITEAKKRKISDESDNLRSKLTQSRLELENFVKSMNSEIAEKCEKLEEERRRKIEENKLRIGALNEELAEKNQTLDHITKVFNDISNKISFLNVECTTLGNEYNSICVSIERISSAINNMQKNIERAGEISKQISERKEKLASFSGAVSSILAEKKILEWINKNIPYIKLHKLHSVTMDLSEMVNKHLLDMGDSTRVRVVSFSEKKNKKGISDFVDMLKSDIRMEVVDGEKNIDIKLYSDGEINKITNAMMRAVHDISMKFGSGCNVMMMDEVFSFLDKDNSHKMAFSLSNRKPGSTIIITDNSGIAENLIRFDAVWKAIKRNDVTTLEV